jgi:hypothetical protein
MFITTTERKTIKRANHLGIIGIAIGMDKD